MIDLSAAPKRIQELMDEGHTIDEAVVEAETAGLGIEWWVREDDILVIEFHHVATGTRWMARFSGYDAERVEVYGLVNSWEA